MKRTPRILFPLLLTGFLLGLFTQCHNDSTQTSSDYLAVPRLDSLLFAPSGVEKVVAADRPMATLWGQLLGASPDQDPRPILQRFASDTLIRRVQDTINRVFPRSLRPDAPLRDAFAALKALAPNHPNPRLVYYNSGFTASFLVADSLLAVGLDRFLGAGSTFYAALGMPRYLAEHMRPADIVPRALEAWLSSEYPLSDPRPSILDQMIYNGKIKATIVRLLPNVADTIALQYSAEALDWLDASEKEIWTYLSEKRLLYEKNQLIVSQFTRPAPFTSAFGQKSPGEAVNWLGYRIVASYQKTHPETSLDALFALPAETVLQQSKYRP